MRKHVFKREGYRSGELRTAIFSRASSLFLPLSARGEMCLSSTGES